MSYVKGFGIWLEFVSTIEMKIAVAWLCFRTVPDIGPETAL